MTSNVLFLNSDKTEVIEFDPKLFRDLLDHTVT